MCSTNADRGHRSLRAQVTDEIFGPVLAVAKFSTEEEAIEIANDSTYGLTAHIFSQDISRAIRVAHAMESGNAFVGVTIVY